MANQPTITVGQFLAEGRKRLGLQVLAGESEAALAREIPEPLAHRPGLGLSGFFEHFAGKRIQVIGLAEYAYLLSLPEDLRNQRIGQLFEQQIPCIVFTRGQDAFPEVLRLGNEKQVAIFKTDLETRYFVHTSAFVLENVLVPKVSIHGTRVEVAGLGVLMEGDPGVGKSETALGLIKRGHALVADDFTVLRRNADNELIASANNLTQNYMEIRGVGIIYVPWIFGISSVRGEKKLDMVITFVKSDAAEFDRTGLDEMYREFLGVKVPQRVIPVAPGRDLVNIVETAAQAYKLKMTNGYVAGAELDDRLKKRHLEKE